MAENFLISTNEETLTSLLDPLACTPVHATAAMAALQSKLGDLGDATAAAAESQVEKLRELSEDLMLKFKQPREAHQEVSDVRDVCRSWSG